MMNSLLKNKSFSIFRSVGLNLTRTSFFACFFLISNSIYAEITESELSLLSKSAGTKVQLEKVAKGLSIPWGMSFLSKYELLITERNGQIKLLDLKSKQLHKIKNPPKVFSKGQAGLLDVAAGPDYNTSQWIYFTYVKNLDEQGVTTLARAKLNQYQLQQWQDLLVTQSNTDELQHFGSRIAFDNKGHIFFGIGDRGERSSAQDLSNHAGTIIRLNLDGSIPSDNPFINKDNILPEIWSYGHRNPQGLSYDSKNNRLWEIEHGPRGGDEINLIHPSFNYGWPVISYGKEYWSPMSVGEGTHRRGMQQPRKIYTPSIAPGSLLYYSGDALPQWKGNLFTGALKLRHINRVIINKEGEMINEERLLESLDQRIRALAQSREGWLYFSTDSGNIYRLRPTQ